MTRPATPPLRAYVQLHFLVLIWGFTAILGLLVSVSSVALVFYRTALAAVGLAVVVLVRKQSFDVPRRDLVRMLLVGLLLATHWILFFASARVATASVCLAGMSTTSLWTSVVEPLINRQRVRPLEVGLGLVAVVGLYIVFRFEFDHALGLLLAIASAFLAALFTVANSHLVKRYDAFVITFYEMIGASVCSLLFVLVFHGLGWSGEVPLWPRAQDWLWILVLAWVCTVYAYSMGTQLMKQFSAFMLNLTINLEPVYGIALAFLIFGEKERMTFGFYLGTLVILLAVVAYPTLANTRLGRRGSRQS
ncbi:DMT family transporter [Rhabdobacter roseus]|uniref:Drug/metabolite transporter (DMT)-like permease n=1 Tax=Rhabdobacter roseus TaxID=1655419 RepID=A0A840TXZ8_9BACT|nr:DMT family transporter [Rhabdobacter roseus]MBB5284519.1 drug/metabolite transporter (DMT)-like permease [Rhabdobacter roseus]